MSEQIIFLKERFSFFIDHIELFLEDYNRLTTTYHDLTSKLEHHFDFYLISNANRYIWEHFDMDVGDFSIVSNTSSLLNGLVKGKEYIIPPIFSKKQIQNFLYKLERYYMAVEYQLHQQYSEKIEKIYGELNDNQIHLQIKVNGDIKLFSLEEVCKMILCSRDIESFNIFLKEKKFTSRVEMELQYLERIIEQYLKISIS